MTDTNEARIEELRAAQSEGRFDDAIALLEGIVAAAPRDISSLTQLVNLAGTLHMWSKTARYAEQLALIVDATRADEYLVACTWLVRALSKTAQTASMQHALAPFRRDIAAIAASMGTFTEITSATGSKGVRVSYIAEIIGLSRDTILGGMCMEAWSGGRKHMQGMYEISPVADLVGWCARNAIEVHTIVPDQQVIARGSDKEWHYRAAAFICAQIPRGEIFAGWSYVRTPNGEVISDSAATPFDISSTNTVSHLYFPNETALHRWSRDVEHIDRDAMFLNGHAGFHVGHWIMDHLPMLRSIQGTAFAVAVPKEIGDKSRDLLALCGYPAESLIVCDSGKRYRFRTLMVSRPPDGHNPAPEAVRFVAEKLRDSNRSKDAGARLFIKRGLGTRAVRNMTEVSTLLDEYGFRQIDLAITSIADQRRILGQAEIVIATYGSDLLSYYFMPEGAVLIELVWSDTFEAAAGQSCAFLDLGYHRLVCEPAASGQAYYSKDTDFLVDCAALRRLLDTATSL